MTGLRRRIRDAKLLQLGTGPLTAPETDQVRAWIELHLKRDGTPELGSITWEYARWKPGVSLTTTFALDWADGSSDLLTAKSYADGKERLLQSRPLGGAHWDAVSPRLNLRVVLRKECTVLSVPQADRELPGMLVLSDPKRVAKCLRDANLVQAGSVRRRRLGVELLRYKPERRAVYRMDVRLRAESKQHLLLGCRVLPRQDAQRLVSLRQAFQSAAVHVASPQLVGHAVRFGMLFEPWQAVTPASHDSFDLAYAAGSCLARWHAVELPADHGQHVATTDLRGLRPLLELCGTDLDWQAPLHELRPARATWCHGDFHPDQLACDAGGGWRLLDLDCLCVSDPATDLASWIADQLDEQSSTDFDSAARELLLGYASAGGQTVDERHLRLLTARALVERAAATLRRLESGAIDRARLSLSKARATLP